jgi:beta-glucosidase
MSKEGKGSKALRGFANTALALACVMTCGTIIANQLASYVNQALGTSSVKIISNTDADTTYYKSEFNSVTELVKAREEMNAKVASEGAALLRNENSALPLASGAKVTLLGMASHQPMYDIGQGAAAIGNDDQIVSYETAFEQKGLKLNPTMISFYEGLKTKYVPSYQGSYTGAGSVVIGEVPQSEYSSTQTNSFKDYNDAAIIMLERNIGEGGDLPDTAKASNLPDGDGTHDALQIQNNERELIKMAKQNFSKVIVLLDSSNPIEVGELESGDLAVDAVMWVGGVGCNGSLGIADLIVGNASPSGGLVDTYATNNHSTPAMMNYGDFKFSNADSINNGYGKSYIVEAEGVYVGYKYYETRYEDAVLGQGNAVSTAGTYASTGNWDYAAEVVYPFGFGLTYTSFSEEIVSCDLKDDVLTVKVKVTNTGDVAGMDNVQLYMQAPYTAYDETNLVEKPFTFVGCVKTSELKKGADETVTIEVDKELMASYDYVNEKTYILEAGDYWFSVGDGAHSAVNNYLAVAKNATNLTDEQGNAYTANTKGAKKITVSNTQLLNEGANGTEITNQFEDFADLNSFQPGTVTYLTRKDWNGTYPKSYTGVEAKGTSPNGINMFDELAGDTYVADETATIDFDYGNPNNTEYTVSQMIGITDYDSEVWDYLLDQMTIMDYVALAFPILDVSMFSGASIGYGVSFPGGTGSEGPSGNDVGFCTSEDHATTNTPYYMTAAEEADSYLKNYSCSSMHQQSLLAATFNPALARRMGEIFGEDTLWTHNTAMEIGVNNHRTAYSGRNSEYYSECGNLSYIMGYEEAAGIESKGGYAMPKHYFGNDQETNRQGLATFANEAAMREIQMRASEGAFKKAGARKYMTSFSRYGVIQAAYCSEAMNVIREEWGVEWAVNMTDMAMADLMYGARSVVNGSDTFCSFFWGGSMDYSATYGSEETVKKDANLCKALRESAKRQLYIWANSNDANGYAADTKFVSITPWWKFALIGIDVALGVLAVASTILYVYSLKSGKKYENEEA